MVPSKTYLICIYICIYIYMYGYNYIYTVATSTYSVYISMILYGCKNRII